MALTLFTDTFVTVAQANTLLSGDSSWINASLADQEQALRNATRELNNLRWIGTASSGTQPLAFPRGKFTYFDPVYNLNIEVAEGDVPERLKTATTNLALHFILYPEATSRYTASFEKIKLGPLELEDKDTNNSVPTIPYQKVTALLEPLIISGSTGGSWWRAN